MRTSNLTDAEIRSLGYRALVERLGAVGAARFIRQHENATDDYSGTAGPLEDMTTEEIYREAARLERELREESE
ncbi:MAG: hypothetical protein H0V53_09905 [Rubrobacter sp.]|jgi:hypothetical protein|nr:hypothetical protein [Rubrobacter sp.]